MSDEPKKDESGIVGHNPAHDSPVSDENQEKKPEEPVIHHSQPTDDISKKQQAIKKWLSDRYNLGLAGVLVLAFVIRVYYFFLTKNQPHWWDSLAYGSLAKQAVLGIWSDNVFLANEAIIRAPLLPLLWGFLLRLNIPEAGIIFILQFIPSLVSVWLVYLIGKELYSKKVGLVAAFLLAVSWVHLFYSARIMTDIPSLFFSLLAIYFFIKSYRDFRLKEFSLAIFFVSLAILTRNQYLMVGLTFVVFLVLTQKLKFLTKKNFWIGGFIGITPIIAFFINNLITQGHFFPAVSYYTASATEKPGYAYYVVTNFFPHILQNWLLIVFVFGLLVVIWELVLTFGLFNKISKSRSHLFLILLMIFSLGFFIFILRAAEDRYLFMNFISLLLITSYGIFLIYGILRKYDKRVAIVFLIAILAIGAYSQFSYGHEIIEGRSVSYVQMKEAFQWINENTPEGSVVVGDGIDLYSIYYAERETQPFILDDLPSSLEGADYVIIHGFEYQNQQSIDFVNSVQGTLLVPEKVVFFDEQQQAPAVVIYKIIQ